MRFMIVALMAGGLVLSACAGRESEQTKALRAAIAFQGDDPTASLPLLDQSYQCSITVLLQPTPRATLIPNVFGNCMWKMEQQSNVWYATFSETWSCSDFSAVVANYPPCSRATGTHTWQYLVDSLQHVEPLTDDGNFAPDMKR
jgi:hypothetical protein